MEKYLIGLESTGSTLYELLYILFRMHVGLSISIGAGLFKVFYKIAEAGSQK